MVINGDPKTFKSKDCHVELNWFDRVFNDQLEGYANWCPENEHANEGLGFKEYLERIDGYNNDVNLDIRWWEYEGKACKGQPAPLVICFTEYINTCWHRLADEYGIYILAFEYHRNQKPPEGGLGAKGFGPAIEEIRGYKYVADRMMEKYPIDKNRVYINGLSYGDMSAVNYARDYGDTLAGIVLIDGPSSPFNIQEFKFDNLPALPVLQIRGNSDLTCDGFPDGMSFDAKGNFEWLRYMRSKINVINRGVI